MNSNNKILFLDIDGVISINNNWDSDLVSKINKVIIATGCKVVLSSTWRFSDNSVIKQHFTNYGGDIIYQSIVGKTRDLGSRTKEIKNYIYNYNVQKYAVIDDLDLSDLGDVFIKTDDTKGITDNDVDKLISLLS